MENEWSKINIGYPLPNMACFENIGAENIDEMLDEIIKMNFFPLD